MNFGLNHATGAESKLWPAYRQSNVLPLPAFYLQYDFWNTALCLAQSSIIFWSDVAWLIDKEIGIIIVTDTVVFREYDDKKQNVYEYKNTFRQGVLLVILQGNLFQSR